MDIGSYRVTATATDGSTPPRVQTTPGTSSPVTVDGLYPGSTYTFTGVAINSAGASVASAPSDPVTIASAPGAPTDVSATAGTDGSAEISFAAPLSDSGAAITSYTVTATDSAGGGGRGRTGSGSPLTVTGRTPGRGYTLTVTATSQAGTSSSSAASNTLSSTGTGAGRASSGPTFSSPDTASVSAAGPARSFQVSTTEAGVTFAAIGALPEGVTLSGSGLLSGNPKKQEVGIYPVTIVAVGSNMATSTQKSTLTVRVK